MQLTDDQKKAMRKWAAEGASLSDVQKRLAEQFGLKVTYLDLRFAMLDLGAEVKDRQASNVPPMPSRAAAKGHEPEPEPVEPEVEEESFPGGGGSVSVEIDRIIKPGAIVSGSARFSDGVKANWSLDQMGRLALDAGKPGYRPSDEDVRAFQVEISRELQKRGF